jgi:hypothetical protein
VVAGVLDVMGNVRSAVDALHSIDLGGLSDAALCEHITALRREIDRMEAGFSDAVAVAHRRGAASAGGFVSTAAFLRHAVHLTHGAARTRVDAVMSLADHPAIAAAFSNGEISHPHVVIVTEALAALPPEIAIDAEPVLLEAAKHLDTGRLHQVARRVRHIADPAGQAGIDARHHESRWLDLASTFSGMVAITGMLDPETGAVLRTAIDAFNKPVPGDERTASTRRADALHELARQSLDSGALPDIGGERPHLTVTVDLDSLAGLPFSAPAELAWAGPLGADDARRLSCDSTVTRILYTRNRDVAARYAAGSGAADVPISELVVPGSPYWQALPPPLRARSLPLDVGAATRTISPALRKALILRDGGCAMPGCDRPPWWTDAHHLVHWAEGGPTCLSNLCLLCRRHHRFIHQQHWILTLNPDGSLDAQPPPTRHLADVA